MGAGAATVDRPARLAGPGWLVALLTAAVFLSYIDRNLIAVAGPLIKEEFGLSATAFGVAVSAFFWTYTPAQFLGGALVDRFPPRRLFGAGVGVWGLATLATAAVAGLPALVAARIGLGVGQSFLFCGSSKLLALHCEPRRRGAANGFIMAGLAGGQAIGALVGGLVIATFGWRAMFLLFGLVTLLWLVAWRALRLADPPAPEPGATPAPPAAPVPMRAILGQRALWASAAGHFLNNYAFYFMITWLPLYLVSERGFSITQMAAITGAAYGAQLLAALAGGWLSDRLALRHAHGEGGARQLVMVGANIVKAGSILGVALAGSEAAMIGWIVLNAITTGFTSAQNFAIPQLFAGPRAAGRWVGTQNFTANFAGVLGPIITGVLIDATGSFETPFLLAAALTLASALCWGPLLGRVAPIHWDAPGPPGRTVPAAG